MSSTEQIQIPPQEQQQQSSIEFV